ncbi:hypothetical protein ABGV42_01170 [Paenibacillus pabuli]|uniref:hypothetical protein n=1 Tax=Paenibacillus pabuli TaxID=1472 RepID=UPI0032420E53
MLNVNTVIYDIVRPKYGGALVVGYLVKNESTGVIVGKTHDEIIAEFYNGFMYCNFGNMDAGGVFFPGSSRMIYEEQAHDFQLSKKLQLNLDSAEPEGIIVQGYLKVDGLQPPESQLNK